MTKFNQNVLLSSLFPSGSFSFHCPTYLFLVMLSAFHIHCIMAAKQQYTLDVPTITACSKFEELLVPGHSACVFVLPNLLFACPACSLISNTASGLEAHIKGKKDCSWCVEYSWKFGPWVRLELGQKAPSVKNANPTQYPNIKWETKILGKNVTDEQLDAANVVNKKWLGDHGFPTTKSKRNNYVKPAPKPAATIF
jgi:hypothetical protein